MHLRDALEERDCNSCAELSEGASGADIQKPSGMPAEGRGGLEGPSNLQTCSCTFQSRLLFPGDIEGECCSRDRSCCGRCRFGHGTRQSRDLIEAPSDF